MSLERWRGYDEQSWQERFAELDRQYNELLNSASRAIFALVPKNKPTPPERAMVLEEADIDRVFDEPVLQQARRLGIRGGTIETPGAWMCRTRKAALLEALSASPTEVVGTPTKGEYP